MEGYINYKWHTSSSFFCINGFLEYISTEDICLKEPNLNILFLLQKQNV